MNTLKFKKIYYAPGIISLIVLSIAFYCFTKSELRKRNVWGISIAWADTAYFRENNLMEPWFDGIFPIKRNYQVITLSDNPLENSESLHLARKMVRKILDARDTSNGIHFIFNNSTRYKTFIAVLNILRKEKAQYYAPLDNNIWFSHQEKRDEQATEEIGTLLCGTADYMISYTEDKESWQEKIKLNWKSSWQLILLFSLFVLLVFVLKIKGAIYTVINTPF